MDPPVATLNNGERQVEGTADSERSGAEELDSREVVSSAASIHGPVGHRPNEGCAQGCL